VASVSGLNVAQQDLAISLGASQGQLLWVINGYTMALAALLLPIGAIGDRWGRKPILMMGLALFAGANTMAGFAGSTEMLLVARVLAGVAAAMIMPVTLSVITSSFPAEQRARAVGIWSGFAGAGGILGLFVSSFLIDQFTWPWLFAMPVLFAAVSLVMTWRVVGNSREDHEGRFDVLGSVLSALAIGGIVLGIHEGPERGWTSGIALFGLVVGVAALLGFIAWELRNSRPLLEIRLFANRGLAAGSVTLLILFAVMFGIFLVLTQFLQAVLGYSALQASAGLLPMAALMMPLSAMAPSLAKRVGTRNVLMVGVGLFGIGLALLALMVSASGGYLSVLPGLLIVGVGIGLGMSPSTTAITESLPAEKQGVASALNDTSRELGGAVGIALLGSVLAAGYKAAIEPLLAGVPADLAEPASEGIGAAFAVAARAGDQAPMIIDAAQHAFVDGWVRSMWLGVGMAAVALVYLLVRGPVRSPAETSVETSDIVLAASSNPTT
jgi:EmrB/QacA subfamily drug resistance transporter